MQDNVQRVLTALSALFLSLPLPLRLDVELLRPPSPSRSPGCSPDSAPMLDPSSIRIHHDVFHHVVCLLDTSLSSYIGFLLSSSSFSATHSFCVHLLFSPMLFTGTFTSFLCLSRASCAFLSSSHSSLSLLSSRSSRFLVSFLLCSSLLFCAALCSSLLSAALSCSQLLSLLSAPRIVLHFCCSGTSLLLPVPLCCSLLLCAPQFFLLRVLLTLLFLFLTLQLLLLLVLLELFLVFFCSISSSYSSSSSSSSCSFSS